MPVLTLCFFVIPYFRTKNDGKKWCQGFVQFFACRNGAIRGQKTSILDLSQETDHIKNNIIKSCSEAEFMKVQFR